MKKYMYKKQFLLFGFLLFLNIALFPQRSDSGKDYTEKIAGSDLEIAMVFIPEGEFTMGSSLEEKNRKEDEGPAHRVKISSFWMGKYEIPWEVYLLFVNRQIDGVATENKGSEVEMAVDAVSGATVPYVDMSLGMGKTGYPVVNITQKAASKFCEWLSAKTGRFYRLPTEAEWEFACRAGTETAYSFGDDEALLPEYAWYYENSDGGYKKGGQKRPNPWGLYDMHGNVAEWTLDQYLPDGYAQYGEITVDPIDFPNKLYPRAVRGGSWDDDSDMLRSAARLGSSSEWNRRDPQLPKSVSWNTDAGFVGFRIVRPAEVPAKKDFEKYWGPKILKK
ncbi:formylglycine-generating enzyme family protein [Flavobacteriaceae bacterium F89]|uniref:Formylglycine-generating enzyme family protein n=1 Tax=Cerina litoralis TaxID=2874477 RepID=A0AAE3ESU0_9FLAO|nr:formylglycine-generating enzyme family protein [Cerina litoralis]MCG2460512.1 formylglycine-generating enzyme family protein [Cerina litoralis]